MTGKAPIRTIAVAGGGTVGLSAALAFARALPRARVQLIDLPIDPAALADRMPGTLPAIRHFHRLVGIAEPDLVRDAQASYRLGTRFEDWTDSGRAWHHCFGRHGAVIEASPFHHQWLRLREEPGTRDYDCYAPAAALARAGKFVHPADDQNALLGSHDYALRLDPRSYRELLRSEAARARVAIRAGTLADVRVEGGLVEALRLEVGSEVRADLFVDCAGPGAPILSRLDGAFEDWSEALPCDRLVVRWSAGEAPGPLDHARATDSGYQFAIPMLAQALKGWAFSSAISGEHEAGGGERIAFRPGRVRASWVRNVVAFGDSAVVVDPLESTNLYLAQNAIRRAVTLIPDTDFHPLVLAEFNRRTAAEADRVRDFVAAHFLASRRRSGGFWQSMETRSAPDSLAHTLEQFEGRGRLPRFEEESFSEDSWLALLIGLGIVPKRIDPTVHRIDKATSAAMLEQIRTTCNALPERLPDYPSYMAQLRRG